MSPGFSDYMNFLSPETAKKIEAQINERERTGSKPEVIAKRKSLFYDLRPVRLTTDPEETADGWSAEFTFIPEGGENQGNNPSRDETAYKVYFAGDGVPGCHKDDIIYAANRGRFFAVCSCEPEIRFVRIINSDSYGLNAWMYQVQEVQPVYENSGPQFRFCDITGQGVNLLEIDNLDTGMLGMGVDITNEQNIGETVAVNHINPAPNGVVVAAHRITRFDTGVPYYIFQFNNPLSTGWGHVVKTLESTFSESAIFTLCGEDVEVTCPLLNPGETLPAGTKVIISQNFETTNWEIIEAQCSPTDDPETPE